MAFEYRLPDVGEGLVEAEIVSWKVKPGDQVAVNDVIVEIETSKSLVELPCPEAGRIGRLLVPEGQVVEVGTPIVSIETASSGAAGAAETVGPEGSAADRSGSAPAESAPAASDQAASDQAAAGQDEENVKTLVGYGPRASSTKRRPRRRTAGGAGGTGGSVGDSSTAANGQASAGESVGSTAERNGAVAVSGAAAPAVSPAPAGTASTGTGATGTGATGTASTGAASGPTGEPATGAPTQARANGPVPAKPPVRKLAKDLGIDLGQVPATGPNGTVTRADLEAYRSGATATASTARGTAAAGVPAPVGGDTETRIPIRGVRRTTAKAVTQSAFTAPHVTEWLTVDVSATMELLDRMRARREFAEVKVTPLLLAAKAAMLALRRTPELNATWDETAGEIVLKHYVHLGIAVDTPRGLLVPNVRNADRMALPELAGELATLTRTAREGATQPSQMAGTTFSITNVGVFGVDAGTPILNPGETGILAIGQIDRRPWVVQENGEEAIRPRWVTTLALSFDHRVVDGAQGSRFLADVAAMLRDPGLTAMF